MGHTTTNKTTTDAKKKKNTYNKSICIKHIRRVGYGGKRMREWGTQKKKEGIINEPTKAATITQNKRGAWTD